MKSHLHQDYACRKCTEAYIPFSVEQKNCPKCDELADRVIDFIPEVVNAARENISWGFFIPMSLSDMYVSKAMNIFQAVDPDIRNGKITLENPNGIDILCGEIANQLAMNEFKPHLIGHYKAFTYAVIKQSYMDGFDVNDITPNYEQVKRQMERTKKMLEGLPRIPSIPRMPNVDEIYESLFGNSDGVTDRNFVEDIADAITKGGSNKNSPMAEGRFST